MARPSPYPLEMRRRAVRIVAGVRPDYNTEWAAMETVAVKLGIDTTETLRKWVRQGHTVARCTVEHLMRELGITGAVRQAARTANHEVIGPLLPCHQVPSVKWPAATAPAA